MGEMCVHFLLPLLKTIGLVSFYYSFSISLTFYNKWVLMGYPFPVSITMIHLIIKFLLAWFVRKVSGCATTKPPVMLQWKEYLKHIVPIAVFSALDIGLSNWSFLFITVSFLWSLSHPSLYTMSKSTALIFILLFAIIFRLEQPRVVLIVVVLMIVTGLFLFTYQSTTFDVGGFILVMSASVITGLRWTTAQLFLQKEELGLSNPIDTVFHLQPIMIITLLPLAIPVDGTAMSTSVLVFRASNMVEFGWTVAYIIPAGVLAFMLAVSEYLLVFHTSGLTLSISGVLKEVIILTISTLWWEEERLKTINIAGMVVCVAGIALHVLVKGLAARKAHKEKSSLESAEDSVKLLPNPESGGDKVLGSDSDEEVVYDNTKV